MSLIDLILNLAALLLWLNWRSLGLDPFRKTSPATLGGTLRRAEPQRLKGWHFLVAIGALLFLRALLYWQIGPAVNWTPNLKLVAIAISFRSDFFDRMLLYSLLSFTVVLAGFYLCALLLSVVSSRSAEADPLQRLLRVHLGWIDRWPGPLKLALPLLAAAAFWLLISPILGHLGIIPQALSTRHLLEQAGIIGLGAYLTWKYVIGGILFLCVLSSYIYLGNHWFWNFVAVAGRNLLKPISWIPLRLGKVDLAPFAGMIVVFLIAEFAERSLTDLYERLPL